MDVLVTFLDGTTELRDGTSPLLVRHRWVDYQRVLPPVNAVIDMRPYYSDGWGLWLVTAEDRLLDTCAAAVQMSARRGDGGWVWCITGGRCKGEPLTGEWRACKVESVAEQIDRLTRERDALRALTDYLGSQLGQRDQEQARIVEERDDAVERTEELRAILEAGTSTNAEASVTKGPIARAFSHACLRALDAAPNFTSFKIHDGRSVLAIVTIRRPDGNTPEEKYHAARDEWDADKARAEAAEKRLADLRAWAEHEAREWGAVFPEDESTWHEVLRRVDGKEDT